jgi:drug/metabolite transporter (DMT)-like permease
LPEKGYHLIRHLFRKDREKMSIWTSIFLITLCAVCWDVGVVLQKQAADNLPRMELGKDIHKILWAFITSRKWMGGLVISGIGWGLFALALNYTPISLARAIQGSGFVILAFFSILFLDHRLKIWEWAGVITVTAGIVALGLSEPVENQTTSIIIPFRLILALGISCAACLGIYAARKLFNFGFSWVVAFSIAAGVLLGMGDVLTKGLLVEAGDNSYLTAFGIMGPGLIFFYLVGFFILSRGYQHGRAILVTGVSDFCARLITIILGVYAMGEIFPENILLRDMRIGGLAAILLGTILLARFSGEQLAEKLTES